MAEDALPKDERRQTMKRIIAILLALIMIFAFAACKGKDDKNDTTAESSQDANADVQDTQTGDAESNAAESTADDTAVAPSEGGSEAATQGQQGGSQGGQQGNKPAAEIKAPVNGSKADIVAFFNKYATAMKQYKGKVTVKRVQGTTSKINSLDPNKILGVDLVAKAEPLLPNDYPKTATQTFNGGKAADGTTLASFLPASKRAAYNVNPAGVKSASCVKQGNWKVSITLVVESGEGLTFVPTHHGSCFDTLSLTPDDFKPFNPKSTKVTYQSGTFTFVLRADGTLASISVSEPANVVCRLTFGNSNVGIDADFTGTWKQDFTFTY